MVVIVTLEWEQKAETSVRMKYEKGKREFERRTRLGKETGSGEGRGGGGKEGALGACLEEN